MERTIDLTKTVNYVINVDSDTSRLSEVTQVLDTLEMPFIRFSADTTPSPPNPYGKHLIACSKSHLSLLKKMKPPTLVFEDDIVPTKNFSKTLSIPEDADAVYLGVSTYGTVRNNYFGYPGVVMTTQETETMKRVYNMCGAHAVLYLSQEYIDAAISIVENYIERQVIVDVTLPHIHKDFKILTPNNPFFYQKDQATATNLSLKI